MHSSKTDAVPERDRIQLPLHFDARRLQKEIIALKLGAFVEYSVVSLRAPAHMVDPSVTPPPPADDYADGTWTEWRDTPVLNDCPYLSEVVDTFRPHCRVTLVRLLRLAPGGDVKEHTDPTLGLHVPNSVIRLTVPIFSDHDCTFYLNQQPVPMQPGECWYLNLTDPHRITNSSDRERINMTIDVAPNEWVRSMLSHR